MTIQMDSSTFNEEVIKQIEIIRDIIYNKITPENIKYFDGNLINVLRDRFWSNDFSKLEWSDDSNANGYEFNKINGMIRYLKTSKTRVSTETFKFDPEDNYDTGDYVVYEYTIKVPKNFDGRNAFVEFLDAYTNSSVLGLTSRQVINPSLEKRRAVDFFSVFTNADSPVVTKLNITQNQTEIKIEVKYRQIAAASALHLISDFDIYGRVTYWRYV